MSEYIPYCHCCGNRHADIGLLCESCHDYTTRLRALVRSAYEEGGEASTARGYLVPEDWDGSEAKKELERQQ